MCWDFKAKTLYFNFQFIYNSQAASRKERKTQSAKRKTTVQSLKESFGFFVVVLRFSFYALHLPTH